MTNCVVTTKMEYSLSVEDFGRTCRACLSTRRNLVLRSLTDKALHHKYTKFTGLEVSANDDLPQKICAACVRKCEQGVAFQESCATNETILLIVASAVQNDMGSGGGHAEAPLVKAEGTSQDTALDDDNVMEGCFNDDVAVKAEEQAPEQRLEAGVDDVIEEMADGAEMRQDSDDSEQQETPQKRQSRKSNGDYDESDVKYNVRCPYCENVFYGAEAFEDHVAVHSKETDHSCKECGLAYKTIAGLRRHAYKHSQYYRSHDQAFSTAGKCRVPKPVGGECSIRCQVCDTVYTSIDVFESHLSEHNDLTKYICLQCGLQFEKKSHFKTHMYEHSDFMFPCRKCGQEFESPSAIAKHGLACKAQCVCEICGMVCVSRNVLRRHIIGHSEERPFKCDVCGKGSKTSQMLALHRVRHTNERKFQCDVCERAFVIRSDLTDHKRRMHTQLLAHVCQICGKGCSGPERLRVHMRQHTGERPYQCDLCPARFVRAHKLKDHQTVHTGEKPFACDVCQKTFRLRWTLRVHLKRHNM